MPLKLILFTVIFDIIFLSAATKPWTIKSKYLLNITDIVTSKAIRKNNFHDYNFDDWEETTPLLYFDDTGGIMNKTTGNSTPIQETESLVTDITTEGAKNSDDTTTVDDEEANSPETAAPSNTTVKDVLEHYLTTTEADIWTTDIHVINNTISTVETQPTVNPLLLQVKAVMEAHKFGYFTSLLIVFMGTVGAMDEKPIEPLKDAFYQEIQGAQTRGRLNMFGPLAEAVLLDIAEMIAQLPADQIKSQAAAYHVQYVNRRTRFSPQTNAIFDVLDSAFESADAMSVLSCFADIQAFPNVTKKAEHISRDLIEHAFYIPYSRIRGTAKDKILMLELDNAIKNRMTGSVRRHQAKKNPKQSKLRNRKPSDRLLRNKTKIKKTKKISSKEQGRQRQNAKKEISKNDKNIRLVYYLFDDLGFDTTKSTSTTDVDLDYLRNKTIMAELKERMKLYKKKFRIIRKKENQTGIQRGKTTTTTTTTRKPKMRKSKYYIRKYVKKNLYKMKTTTPTTTTKSRWFRKWYQENTTESSSSHEIKSRMKSSTYINNRNVFNKRTSPYIPKREWATRENQYTTVKSKIVDLKLKIKGFRKITDISDYSSYEDDLKANVRDAIVHGREHDLSLFKDKRRYDKVKSFQSYSNEEPIIKANVYKAFGYGNNFADRLKKLNK